MKLCAIPLIKKEIHFKNTIRYFFLSTGLAKMKNVLMYCCLEYKLMLLYIKGIETSIKLF